MDIFSHTDNYYPGCASADEIYLQDTSFQVSCPLALKDSASFNFQEETKYPEFEYIPCPNESLNLSSNSTPSSVDSFV